MLKKAWFPLLLCLILVSLACNLPLNVLRSASTSAPGEVDILADFLANESSWGKVTSYDNNNDGRMDALYYAFPPETPAEGITLQETAYINNPDGSGFKRWWQYELGNANPDDMAIEMIVDLPKEFAASVDELGFSVQPLEVIEADPKLKFGFRLKGDTPPELQLTVQSLKGDPPADDAGRVFMEEIVSTAAEKCGAPIEKKYEGWHPDWIQKYKNDCLFDLVRDFKPYIPVDIMAQYCDQIIDGSVTKGYRATCNAVVFRDHANCDELKGTSRRACDHFFIQEICMDTPLETRDLCYAEGGLTLNTTAGCALIEDDDVSMDCYARVERDPQLCDEIKDEGLRQQCLALVSGDKTSMSEQVERAELENADFSKYNKWFRQSDAEADCQRFVSMTGFDVTEAEGWDSNIICKYGIGDSLSDIRAVLYIQAFESIDIAKEKWGTEYSASANTGDAGTYIELNKAEGTVHAVDKGTRWEHMSYRELVNPQGMYYELHCASLYLNSVITYRQELMTDKDPSNCARITLESMLLIDSKLGK